MVTSFADLSHYQGSVDLAAYARAGHDRVILKATEGTTVVDERFAERWAAAGRLGLARVAYHFGRAGNSGAAEFDHLLAAVGRLGVRDRLCLDSEDTGAPSRAAAHAREFTTRAVVRGVRAGLVYTGRWYADPHGLTAAVFQPGWRQLWLSDYGTAADGAIGLPAGWTRSQLVARQFTDRATVAGVGSPCDYNRLLRDWLSHPVTPPAPPGNPREDDAVPPIMVYAQGSPLYLYWPATATLVGIGDPTERDTLKKVHAEAGQPIDELKLSPTELDQLVEFTRRVRSQAG